jgi:hypothetical protein
LRVKKYGGDALKIQLVFRSVPVQIAFNYNYMRRISLVPVTCLCFLLFIPGSHAVLTNLVVNGEFETPAVQTYAYNSGILGTKWSTQSNNNFQIYAQGSNGSPTVGTDSPTPLASGRHLEVRGNSTSGIITLTVIIPTNIAPSSNIILNFDSWSRTGGGSSRTGGRYTITVNGSPVTGGATDTTITNVSNAWTLNSNTFAASAGNTVVVSWRESSGGNRDRGLRIDQVQLIADLVVLSTVPEPSTIGALILLGVMTLSALHRRKSNLG